MNFKKRPRISLDYSGSSYLLWESISILLIFFFTIYVFNIPQIFADVLWQDDGYWYYLASEGEVVQEWRAKIAALTPLRDLFYAYGMLGWGVPATRTAFVLVMALTSVSLYFIYSKIFGIVTKVALPAALIPHILPSLISIPMGLNASYAMWGLFPLLLSIGLIYLAFTKSGPSSYFFWLLGLFAYALGLNLSATANFLIPVVLLFFVMFSLVEGNKSKTGVFLLPFLVLGLWQIYKQIVFSHRIPTQIPLDEVIDRSVRLLETGSFLPFNSPVSIYATLFLIMAGLTGLVIGSSHLFVKPPHFGFSDPRYRGMLVLWSFVWIVCNSIAYVAASATFRVVDYAYVANFGTVLLQVCGIVFLWSWIAQRLGWREKFRERGFVLVFAGIIIFTGVQKLEYLNFRLEQTGRVEVSSILRSHLQSLEIPSHGQILIFDAPTSVTGVYWVNTGYIRYLTGREDISALIGPDVFPNDVFAQTSSWQVKMRNFSPDKPVIAFKMQGNELIQKKLLLQTQSTGNGTLPRIRWSLFDISQPGSLPLKIAGDLGMSSFNTYINDQLPRPFTPGDIVFAPGDNPSTFLSTKRADEVAINTGLIDGEMNFGDIVTLRAVREIRVDPGQALKLLFQVHNKPRDVILGYRINGKRPIRRVSIWEMAMDGDNVLMNIPISNKQKTTGQITFEFMDMTKGLLGPIPLKDNNNISKIELILR